MSSPPAISVRNLSKCYKLGTIGRHTLVDECQYLWHKLRGRDPRQHMTKIGHTATEARKVEAEQEGNQEFWALKDVSFDVQPGEVVGIIGRNGAGKSTLLKLLTRITEPSFGEMILNGRVASLLEVGTGFHQELTGRENIYMNGAILGMKRREIDAKLDQIIAFSEIEKFIDTPVKRYSSGMYVRLAFAVAAHLDPEILLVDEVLAVGDATFQKKCLGKMGELATSGRTILFVSHQMNAIRRLCRRCILIDRGVVRMDGSSSEVVPVYESGRGLSDLQENIVSDRRVVYPRGDAPNSINGIGEVVLEGRVCLNRPASRAHCGLALRDDQHNLICSWTFHDLNLPEGLSSLRISVPSMPLRPGIYWLLFSLQDDRERLDLWDAMPPLRIDTPPQDNARDEWTGILNLPGSVEVLRAYNS